ncbi:hypothetical protein MLD38_008318 [Melastoma candidum]|uniref:Uncharacterized protein n=1 Tax=Melastoma candidum TaxID=119954 RepID=A0ACB9S2G4_9MYRT|nr:hypothetical protein MLD38_008318 [Melastoma candidum]
MASPTISRQVLLRLLRPRAISRSISTTIPLLQEPQLAELTPAPPPTLDSNDAATSLSSIPFSGSPLYSSSSWQSPIPPSTLSLIPQLTLFNNSRIQSLSQSLNAASLVNVFADWMTSQHWLDIKQLFEF